MRASVSAIVKMTCDWCMRIGLPLSIQRLGPRYRAHHLARIISRCLMVSEQIFGNKYLQLRMVTRYFLAVSVSMTMIWKRLF